MSKFIVLFKDAEHNILKQVELSRIPNIDENIVLDAIGPGTQITSNNTWRVFHILSIIDPVEKYIVFVQKSEDYIKLYNLQKNFFKFNSQG